MSALRRFRFGDLTAMNCVFAAAFAELAIREIYHQVSAQTFKMFALGALWILVALLCPFAARRLPDRWRPVPGRVALWVAVAAAVWVLAEYRIMAAAETGSLPPILAAALLIAVALVVMSAYLGEANRAKMRQAITAASVLFVMSQPLLVALRAPALAWPPVSSLEHKPVPGARSTTVFLLLDELNAKSALPLVALLRGHGLEVKTKALTPAGDGTAKVIPAMFTRQRFDQPKPCSTTAICSGSNILDFSRVSASRPDIDVVGFYHPYCAINGLRYCARVAPLSPAFDPDRWRCAFGRRLGIADHKSRANCDQVYNRAWTKMADESLEALWRAPVWTEGGFLFLHVALPHLPGVTPGASLQAHYAENLQRAVSMVNEIVDRALSRPNDQLRIAIFSDHPLRQGYWCRNFAPYAARPCADDPDLDDTQVPLIAAGNVELPDIDDITTNDQIFDLGSARQ